MTKLRQLPQIQSSETYTDTTAPGAAAVFEPTFNTSNIEVDLNNIRSMINEIVSSQGGNWYDALGGRDVNTLDIDLTDLEDKRVLCRVSELESVTVGGGANNVILTAPGETPSPDAAIGAVTTLGAVCAELPGAPGTGSTVTVAGQNALQPKNLLSLVDVATDEPPVDSSGNEIFGFLQIENGAVDGDPFDNAANQGQISFVVVNATRTGFNLTTDAGGLTIQYAYVNRTTLDLIPEECFIPYAGFVDNSASIDVTLANAYVNQGVAFAPLSTVITSQTNAVNQSWDVVNAAGANVASLGVGAADGNVLVILGDAAAAVDSITRVNGTDLDINVTNAATIANGMTFEGAPAVDVGVTDGLIESTAALTMESNAAANSMITTGGGNVVLNSSAAVDVDAVTAVTVNTANAADASANTVSITAGNSTAGVAAGAAIDVNTGDGFGAGSGGNFTVNLGSGGGTGVAGFMDVNHAGTDVERVQQLEVTGTGADRIGVFVGSSSPVARVNAGGDIGSLFVDGTAGTMYINTDGATAWTAFAVGGAESWAATLAVGNISGGTDPVLSGGDTFRGVDGAAPTAMAIRGGDATVAATAGAVVNIDGGDGNTSGAGGAVTSTGGIGGTTGVGGSNSVIGGAGGSTSGNGGAADVTGGAATDGSGGTVGVTGGAGGATLGNAPGAVNVTGGAAGAGSGSSGATVTVRGGAPDGTNSGGGVIVAGANAAAVSGGGGSVSMNGGSNVFLSNGSGGPATVGGGNAQGATFTAGAVTVSGGSATSGGLGGDANIFGGGSDASGETLAGAGSIIGTAGNNSGTDRAGDVLFTAGTNLSAGGEGGRVALSAGVSTGAVTAPTFLLVPGTAAGAVDNGFIHIDTANDDDEHIVLLDTAGANGSTTQFLVGDRDPLVALIPALPSSLYWRNRGAAGAGELWLNTSTSAGEATTWEQVLSGTAGTTSLSSAITAEGAGNFVATNSTSWGLADTDSLDITGPGGGGDTILEVNALAAGNTVNINADTIINGNDGVGGNSIQLLAGAGAAATNPGTGVRLVGGAGNTSGAGGTVSAAAGGGGTTGAGGPLVFDSGDGGSTSGVSGAVDISTGTTTDGDTGSITLNAANSAGAGTNGGDIICDAGDSIEQEGGLIILRSGDSTTLDAGYLWLDMPNDDDEHIVQYTTGGTNGTTTHLHTGTANPDGAVLAPGGSLYMRRVVAATGSSLFVNVSAAAGEGTDWDEVMTASSRTFVQGVPSGAIAINTDISDVAPAANMTMDFGTFPTFPATQAEMNTRTKIWINGLLQQAGVDVVRTATQTTAFQSPTTALVVTDVIAIEQFPA